MCSNCETITERKLRELVDDYEPASEEEVEEWLEQAPTPEEIFDRDSDEFAQADLRLSPEMHHAQAEMAAERGEEYDPYEFEERAAANRKSWDDLLSDLEPVEGNEELFEEWLAMGEDS